MPETQVEIPASSLHTAFERGGKWFVTYGGQDVELSDEQIAQAQAAKKENQERDRQTTALAQKAVQDVLHYGFVSKDEQGNSTALNKLVRGIVSTMFKSKFKDMKLPIKALDGDAKSVNNVARLVITNLSADAEEIGETIGTLLKEALTAIEQGFQPGVKCKLDYNAADVVKNYLGFSPSAALKDADMARATSK